MEVDELSGERLPSQQRFAVTASNEPAGDPVRSAGVTRPWRGIL
jgi:hypothetical protein